MMLWIPTIALYLASAILAALEIISLAPLARTHLGKGLIAALCLLLAVSITLTASSAYWAYMGYGPSVAAPALAAAALLLASLWRLRKFLES